MNAAIDFSRFINGRRYKTILADPPWQFINRTGKMAPEHKRLNRYNTLFLLYYYYIVILNNAAHN